MPLDLTVGIFFWGFLLLYGGVMYALSPHARSVSSFFGGTDEAGRPASEWALMCSIFISWIFAKSVTNAANLGAAHGVVGGLAYATYWLSIPLAGIVIYRLRTASRDFSRPCCGSACAIQACSRKALADAA